ncbi:MAG: hypothetical protein EON90_09155 [Brevundimonas sp.]|nr:MAG: hypothetical protein EON90_09155 [Brevundimonas sp.]
MVAGLPAPAYDVVRATLEALFPDLRVTSVAFNHPPGKLYADSRAVFELVKETCRFAADLGHDTCPPRPGRLLLFYVEDTATSHLLLEAFGYGALPVKLSVEDWDWPHGRHWNRNQDVVDAVLTAAIATTRTGRLQALRDRLERAASQEALLLPPRNFEQPDRSPLSIRFDRLRDEGALADDAFDDLDEALFDYDTLPNFFKGVPEPANVFRIDRRGLVFARSMFGQHGFERLSDFENARSVTEFRIPLESAFRFGTPVREGFQHDVQWAGKARLANEVFQDVVDGPTKISGTHANIYTTDRVR